MQRNTLLAQGIAQAVPVVREVLFVQKRGGSIDAPMREMKWQPGHFEAWAAWHRKQGDWAWTESADRAAMWLSVNC